MITDSSRERERRRIELRLAELEIERRALESARQALDGAAVSGNASRSSVTQQTNSHEKLLLFRSLFRGRTDVYPARWENKSSGKSGYAPACANEWVRGVCEKPRIKCGDCTKQAFIAVSDRVVERHLRGDLVAGIYPLIPGNTCYFVAVDFDGEGWIEDSRAFRHACSEHHVPVAVERSRSGAGAHAWIFFAEALAASQARQLATGLMSAALERRPDIGFRSYDRLFPSQDLMPDGGFGNLIALPLQRVARDRGHSVFIDDELNPFLDQWEYLASLKKIEVSVVERLLAVLSSRRHGITGIPLPISDETSPTPWALPQTSSPESHVTESLPKRVPVTLADQIYIDRTALPTTMVTRLMRLAAFRIRSSTRPRRYVCRLLISRVSFPERNCMRIISPCPGVAWTR